MGELDDLRTELGLTEACLRTPLSPELRLRLVGQPLAWIGSGLSRVAGEVGARITTNGLGCAATRFTPLEYCTLERTPYLPILLTYGGGNPDALAVARHISAQKVERAVMVVGHQETKAEAILRDAGIALEVFPVVAHRKERRFVALIPYFTLSALAHRLARGREDGSGLAHCFLRACSQAAEHRPRVRDQILQIKGWRDRRWIVLGGGLALVGALGWQVLLSEASLADLLVADIKDYTHGRYNSALQREDVGFIVLSDPTTKSLVSTLASRFTCLYPTVVIESSGTPEEAMWMHLLVAGAIVGDLCAASGWDLASPPKPPFVKNWSNWGTIRPQAFTEEITS